MYMEFKGHLIRKSQVKYISYDKGFIGIKFIGDPVFTHIEAAEDEFRQLKRKLKYGLFSWIINLYDKLSCQISRRFNLA